jgi:hypothetical protein
MKPFRQLPRQLTVLVLLALTSLPAAAALQAWLDRDQVEPGESVELTLQRDNRSNSQPDLAPLQHDFDILGRASGTNVKIVNGHMSMQTQLRLTLAPKHSGRIEVPALNWDGERSPALGLTVAANSAGMNGGNSGTSTATAPASHVFLTSSVEQKQPYVQAATLLKLRLYTDQPLYQASLDLPASNDVRVQPIGKDRQSSEMRGGRHYQVIERDYLLFPQRSGRISLAGPVLDAQVADAHAADQLGGDPFFGNVFGRTPFAGMMNATRPMRLHGDAVVLDVRPRPASVTGQDWLPAQHVRLEESWRPDSGAFRAGEPITRQLRLSALGLTAAQLPDLAARMPLPDGIKAYPDQAKLNNAQQDGSVSGSREQDIALIASRPGRYQLPALHLTWWDTTRNSPREAILPARTLEILPGVAGAEAAPPPVTRAPTASPAEPSSSTLAFPLPIAGARSTAFPWPWLSLVLGLLWLATLAAWWRKGRTAASSAPAPTASGPDPTRAGEARKAFRQACRDNAAPEARRHLLAWARATWRHDPPAGLAALARRLDGAELPALLRELDRACYAGGDWHGEALAEALSALPGAVEKEYGKPGQLAGLYP